MKSIKPEPLKIHITETYMRMHTVQLDHTCMWHVSSVPTAILIRSHETAIVSPTVQPSHFFWKRIFEDAGHNQIPQSQMQMHGTHAKWPSFHLHKSSLSRSLPIAIYSWYRTTPLASLTEPMCCTPSKSFAFAFLPSPFNLIQVMLSTITSTSNPSKLFQKDVLRLTQTMTMTNE